MLRSNLILLLNHPLLFANISCLIQKCLTDLRDINIISKVSLFHCSTINILLSYSIGFVNLLLTYMKTLHFALLWINSCLIRIHVIKCFCNIFVYIMKFCSFFVYFSLALNLVFELKLTTMIYTISLHLFYTHTYTGVSKSKNLNQRCKQFLFKFYFTLRKSGTPSIFLQLISLNFLNTLYGIMEIYQMLQNNIIMN